MGAGSHSGVPSSLSSRWKKKKMSSYIIIILLVGRHSLSETSSFILLFDVDGFCLCWRPPLSLYSCPLGGVLSFIHLPDYWGSSHYSFHLQRCALNTSISWIFHHLPSSRLGRPISLAHKFRNDSEVFYTLMGYRK